MRRRTLVIAGSAVVLAAAGTAAGLAASSGGPAGPRTTGLLTCAQKPVTRPTTFVLACADANALLTATQWSTWTGTGATGLTRFGLNLCTPSCAASSITYFPHSTVVASAPVDTPKHGRLFSHLVVTYHLHGKTKTYSMDWKGVPAFS